MLNTYTPNCTRLSFFELPLQLLISSLSQDWAPVTQVPILFEIN